ncbi:MAG: tRNA (adenosine(37)-N6)-dimethylallyltransferase MiaA [Chitinivibrionia bacterium]|nr:tRNA (adenosine(37)-N6)-dimethylallyltransferase MiaA [Chitinivibrionia bacterium]
MIPVILGATAVGKSGVAIELAKRINGEIISCDSRQIYKFMDVVTAKPTKEELNSVPHHLIDIVEPNFEYSAAHWVWDCAAAIGEIRERGKIPIICGGTFFYINAMRNGFDCSSSQNVELRKKFEILGENYGYEKLYEILLKKNPKRAKEIHRNDKYRILRALQIECGEKSEFAKCDVEREFSYFVLSRSREKLYERINTRVDKMLENGLFEEYKKICEKYSDPKLPGRNCVGYREFDDLCAKNCKFEDCVNSIKQHSRNYAKRQLTWLRNKEADKKIIDVENANCDSINIARIIGELLFY